MRRWQADGTCRHAVARSEGRGAALLVGILLTASCSGKHEGSIGPASWTAEGIRAVSPLIGEDDTVVVVDGTTPDLQVVVLDAATGQVRFKRPWSTAGQYTGMGVGNPALVSGVMVSMEGWGSETELVAFDAHSGAERWRIGVPAETFSPSPCEKLVCSTQIPHGDEVRVARDPATGTPVWTSTGASIATADQDGTQVQLHLVLPLCPCSTRSHERLGGTPTSGNRSVRRSRPARAGTGIRSTARSWPRSGTSTT